LAKVYRKIPDFSFNCPAEEGVKKILQLGEEEIPPCKKQCCNSQILLTFIEFAYAFDYVRNLLQSYPDILNDILNSSNDPYCIFLSDEKRCLVYDARPYACRCFHRSDLKKPDKCEVNHLNKVAKNIDRLNRAIKQQATETVELLDLKTKENVGTKEMILNYSSPQVQATFEGWLALLGKVLEEKNECS